MKAACFKMIQATAAAVMALSIVGCDNAVFSSKGKSNKAGGPGLLALQDLVFIDDSFERNDIFGDIDNNLIYGWRGYVRDGAVDSVGFTTAGGAGSRIPAAGELGVAADLNRFLLANGDADNDVEVLHVISQSYDLTDYNTVILNFRYVTFGLEDGENLQVQVCRGTLNECGANDDGVNPAGLNSAEWVTVFTSSTNNIDDALNGSNHVAGDWQNVNVFIDLNDPELVGSSSTFVFRFVSTMNNGIGAGGNNPNDPDDHKCRCVASDKHDLKANTASGGDDHDKKDKKHCKHKKHKKHKKCKHHKKCCKRHCEENPNSGLSDGVAIDKVVGTATQTLFEQLQ